MTTTRTSLRLSLAFLVAALLAAVALAGCGGGGGGGGAPDGAAPADAAAPDAPAPDVAAADVVAPDVAPDAPPIVPEDAGADAPAPPADAADAAEDAPDSGGCTCSAVDDCCDGCRPANEGGACGDPCRTPGVCAAGLCTGGGAAIECPPPGPCQDGAGVCDPAAGGCVYAAQPTGTPCEALAGVDGSGLCQGGACFGFGACDHRTYDQPVGWPCNFDAECAEGWCQPWGDEWARTCTRACGDGQAPCPDGTFCVNGGPALGRYCRPLDRTRTLPGDGSQPLFAVCNDDEDCAGGLCLAFGDLRFCAGSCESGATPGRPDAALCGSCGRCQDNGAELGFAFPFYCVPRGEGRPGEPCGFGGDCRNRYCRSGLCSDQCIVYEGVSNCPDHMACVGGLLSDPALHVCVPAEEVGRTLGEPCLGDHACAGEGQVCREVFGERVCTADCAAPAGGGAPVCSEGTCVAADEGETCVPAAWVDGVPYGGRCRGDFECAGEAVCYRGACLLGCDGAADCPDGVCAADAWLRVRYCAPTCAAGEVCPERLSCTGGVCLVDLDGAAPEGSLCRSDDDCRTGLCAGGVCTDTCSAEVPCESSVALPVPPYGLCKPCDPNFFGMDCDEDWGLSECVQGVDGAWFCATECWLRGAAACPVGTRCYGEGTYSAVCQPISGSCTLRAAPCTSRGLCSAPAPAGFPCEEDGDCGAGADAACVLGRCAGPACAVDTDCGCPLLRCAGARCEADAAAGHVETEPDDTLAQAVLLPGGGPQRVLGTLIALAGAPDVDLYRVPLQAGEVLDAWTAPFCGQYADTHLRFFTGDGTPLDEWVFDSLDPSYPFSILLGYVAPADQDVVIEVTQGGWVFGNARVNYVLDVNVFRPASNDACEDALPLAADGQPVTFDLATANGDMVAASCTGAGAPGKDLAFALSVPAQTVLTVYADTPFDSQLYLVADCADLEGTCLAGADVRWEPGPELLVWANEGDEPRDLVLVVDSFLPEADMLFALVAELAPLVAPANDTAAGAIPIPAGTSALEGTTAGAADDYDGGDEGCVGVALPGRDVVYVATLPPGGWLTVVTEAWAGLDPVLLLTSDPADPQGCLAVAQGLVHHRNGGVADETVWLVVDGLAAEAYGSFVLSASLGGPAECFGPCDPRATAWACLAGSAADLCWCDAQTATLTAFDCGAYCVADGALAGACHTFTAPGFERDSCRCDYDCALPNDHCQRSIYTDCTCAAADPCGWQDNGGCDEFCAIEYPADHFDDSADCARAR